MKFKFIFILIFILIFYCFSSFCWSQQKDGEYEFSFDNLYAEEIKKVRANYKANIAKFIKNKATAVEFYLLGERVKETFEEDLFPDKFFHVGAKAGYYQIKEKRRWEGEKMNQLIDLIGEMIVGGTNDVLFSHKPEYGLRVYVKEKPVFQTPISVSSENWCLVYPGAPFDFDWLSLNNETKDVFLESFRK